MAKWKLSARELRALGFPDGPAISVALNLLKKHYKKGSRQELMAVLSKLLTAPVEYLQDADWSPIAEKLVTPPPSEGMQLSLNSEGVPFAIFGRELIEEGALHQMYQAARLPVAVAGALMPDAHAGYGLPIGGVLATENAVIPYAVGVDIGCRMCLSLFELDPALLQQKQSFFKRELEAATLFGSGRQFDQPADHPVMERSEFRELPLAKRLQGRAWKQLGSSGSGNHFVEFGELDLQEGFVHQDGQQLKPGNYLALLSHSGSRALGAEIARHYSALARSKRRLPKEISQLAWLDLAEEEGAAYWKAMNLAGDYASACHHIIHDKLTKALGQMPLARVENHHNFAWMELQGGREWIVHRKGATPAGSGVLGIIPGSMTAPGYLVRGKGAADALHSASHGAGRQMSRSRAQSSVTRHEMRETLRRQGVVLLGGGTDEAPQAYKDITRVMNSQSALVDILGSFHPKIVRMDG